MNSKNENQFIEVNFDDEKFQLSENGYEDSNMKNCK
jgi:hypothetical protein